jgi:hypothetical protein
MKNNIQIIALAGKMGSGKDYLIEKYIIPYIEKSCNKRCLQLSFADQLKINVMTMHNVSYNDVYIEKTNISYYKNKAQNMEEINMVKIYG